MKKLFPLASLAIFLLLMSACQKDSCEQTWTQLATVPVTLDRQAVQDSIEAQGPREFCTGGNLYAYGNYLFVNLPRKGYHVLDNADKSNPTPVGFLQIPGATNMAFVDGRMISDSYADLLVLDFQSHTELELLSSTENFLLEATGFEIPGTEVAIGFEQREVTFTQACDGNVTGRWGGGWEEDALFSADRNSGGGGIGTPNVNTAGSLARMAFCDRSLYVLGNSQLSTYSLTNSDELLNTNNTPMNWGQEALIRRGDFLYVASTSALEIYDIADCDVPTRLGTAPHRWARDPVAVEGNRAVLTTRWGNPDDGNPDDGSSGGEIMVFDITDRTNPELLRRHAMTFPVGIAMHEGTVYVCDEVDGLRVFDFSTELSGGLDRHEIERHEDDGVVDVAVLPYASGTTLLTIGGERLRQYAHQDGGALDQLVSLEVEPCAAL